MNFAYLFWVFRVFVRFSSAAFIFGPCLRFRLLVCTSSAFCRFGPLWGFCCVVCGRFLCPLRRFLGCFAALPGVVFRPLWAFILFCGFFFVCGPFFVLWAFGCFAAFGPGGSVLFWAWLWCMFSAVFARWRLGIICPSFFRVPFGILCGFFCCHCPVLPAAVVVRLSFSAWACILLYMAFNGSIL